MCVAAEGEEVGTDAAKGCGRGLEDIEAKGFGKMGIKGTLVTRLRTKARCGKNSEPGSFKGNLNSSNNTCLLSRILLDGVKHL